MLRLVFSSKEPLSTNCLAGNGTSVIWWENFDYPILNDRLVLTYLKRLGMGKLGLEAQILEETDMFMEYLEGEVVVDADTTLVMFTSNIIVQMMIGQRWQYGDSSTIIPTIIIL